MVPRVGLGRQIRQALSQVQPSQVARQVPQRVALEGEGAARAERTLGRRVRASVELRGAAQEERRELRDGVAAGRPIDIELGQRLR